MSTWWDLPGPGGFADRVATDLDDGRTVVIEVPDPGPDGLYEAVRSRLHRWQWRMLGGSTAPEPIEFLYDRCLPQSPTPLRTSATLAAEDDLSGHILWVDVHEAEAAVRWRTFAQAYAEASRSLLGDPARVVLCTRGALPSKSLSADVAVRQWNGVVSSLDALFFATRLRGLGEASPLMARVAVEIVSRFAAFDPAATAHLARLSFEDLHAPSAALQRFGSERGWSGTAPTEEAQAWARGIVDHMDGRPVTHPAYSISTNQDVVERTLWAAHAAVVFPFIEECRRDLLDVLAPILRLPYEYPVGTGTRRAETKDDLEIGHIHRQLCDRPGEAGRAAIDFTGSLRDARNDLAHLRPLPASRFRAPAFLYSDKILQETRSRLKITGTNPPAAP